MDQLESRLSLGMMTSILVHGLLIFTVFQLNSDQKNKPEIIEVSYYGEGGGTGLIKGKNIEMGAAAKTDTKEWQEAREVAQPAPIELPKPELEPAPQPQQPQVVPEQTSVVKAVPKPKKIIPKKEEPPKKVEAKPVVKEKAVVAKNVPKENIRPPVVKPAKQVPDPDVIANMLAKAESDFAKEAELAKKELQEKLDQEKFAQQEALAASQAAPVGSSDSVSDSINNARQAMAASQVGAGTPASGNGQQDQNSMAANGGGGERNDANGFVRSLADLRQMPGNPKPRYSVDERLRGDQGRVVFHAYVNQNGQLGGFRMIQSSGYQGLDKKTLAAIQKWRFYPGQAGWVELPFDWSLQGGPQEISPLMKKKIGSLYESGNQ